MPRSAVDLALLALQKDGLLRLLRLFIAYYLYRVGPACLGSLPLVLLPRQLTVGPACLGSLPFFSALSTLRFALLTDGLLRLPRLFIAYYLYRVGPACLGSLPLVLLPRQLTVGPACLGSLPFFSALSILRFATFPCFVSSRIFFPHFALILHT